MEQKERILFPVGKIRHGAYLPHQKNTADSKTADLPVPQRVVIPVKQHIGAPCSICVAVGDSVCVGTKIADTDAPVSAPVHASVSGKVEKITWVKTPGGGRCQAVEIVSDGKMTPDPALKPVTVSGKQDLLDAARNCGLVGLGGAGFPAHIKLNPKDPVDTLIINGAECEPYVTTDYRCCLEDQEDLLNGVLLLMEYLGVMRIVIAIENNKKEAIRRLYEIVSDKSDIDDRVQLMELPSKYPQGAEKVIVYSVTGRKLTAGKLPSRAGCIVMNVTTVAKLGHYIRTGMPLVSRRVTVDGSAVGEPKNVQVPIGTPLHEVLAFCQTDFENVRELILGGPMMGTSLPDDDFPVTKTTGAVLAFSERRFLQPTGCIHCGKCAANCPMNLNPSAIERAYRADQAEQIRRLYVDYCMECGCCAFVCPASRPLTQMMRLAKKKAGEQK